MGGRSSSSRSQDVTNYDNRQNISTQSGVAVGGSNNTVTVSDQGSIEKAFDFGQSTLDFAGDTADSSFDFGNYTLDFVGDTFSKMMGTVDKTNKDTKEAYEKATKMVSEATQDSEKTESLFKVVGFIVAIVSTILILPRLIK